MAQDLKPDLEKTTSQGSQRDVASNPPPDDVESPKETKPDPNIVDWDGPDDPHNPLNWPKLKRISQVLLVSAILLVA